MKRSGIRTKMMVGISAPVIVILAVAAALIISSAGRAVTRLVEDRLASDSQAASGQVSEFFTAYLSRAQGGAANVQIETILQATAPGTPLPQSPGYAQMKYTLDRLAATDTQNILACWIGDFDSSQITQSDGYTSPDGWDITARPWYRVKETRAPVLTPPYNDASTGQLIISAASPVFNRGTEEVIGAFGFDIRLDHLGSIMSGYKLGETGFIVLFDGDGQVICHPDASMIRKNVAETSFSDNVKQLVSSGGTGNLVYTINGEPYYGALNTAGTTGWRVLSGLPQREALADYHTVVAIIGVIFTAGLALLIVMILLVSRGISRPLGRLERAAARIAAGELDVAIGIRSSDETGRVAAALSGTVEQLGKYRAYITEITKALDQIAQGDLAFELTHDYAGEFAKIRGALDRIRTTLSDTLRRITQVSDQVASGSDEVAGGAAALAQGATEQAGSIEELAATIGEISGRVQDNARDAGDASRMAGDIDGALSGAQDHMREMTEAMGRIRQSSAEIGKVVKTIEEIALQTNMIALNAAVEAARAGAAGKGFAVVADEVRSLANRSGEAAKSTTEMITGTISAVGRGAHIADEAAQALESAVGDARAMTGKVQNIARASQDQAQAIGQVTIGVDQISAVVQTNSATAEQSAASSAELRSQSKALGELVSRFRLDDGERRHAAAGSRT